MNQSDQADRLIQEIMDKRSEILENFARAYTAKTGLGPDEVELCELREADKTTWFFRKLPDQDEVWIHVPTATIALVSGDFGYFYWNGKREDSYWGLFRQKRTKYGPHGWKKLGEL